MSSTAETTTIEPIKIRNGFQCPECYKEFKNRSGFIMHRHRAHDPAFEAKRQKSFRQAMKKQRQKPENKMATKQSEPVSTQKKSLFDYMYETLKSHGAPMRRADLIAAIRTAGYKGGNEDAMTTSMSGFARMHPERGIIQPERGHYAIGKPEEDYRHSTTTPDNAPVKPVRRQKSKVVVDEPHVDTEVERLRAELHRSKVRAQELIMKMAEVAILALE